MQTFYLIILGLPNGSFVSLEHPDPHKIIGYRVKSIHIFGTPQGNRDREALDYCEKMAAACNIEIQFN